MKYKLQIQTSPYVMLSSDFSQQEPKITATVSQDKKMIQSFKDGKDIYATIAALSFNKTYEECLEFHPETHEYQKEGKERRAEAKSIVLGILYGRSTKTIGEQLYGHDESLTEEERTKKAQGVYNSVLNAFPSLKSFMVNAERQARTLGYVETILGRRRHIPDMMLPDFEFEPMPKYVNPDIDPMNPETLKDQNKIPKRITDKLTKEFKNYKYFGQVVRRTKELKEEKIKVINNRPRIIEASRQIVNCVDKETEILTTHGWKKYNEINVGEQIYSYNLTSKQIEYDTINLIHMYHNGNFDVIGFKSSSFDSLSTPDHKWLCQQGEHEPRFITTEIINRHKWPDYPILRVADNHIESSCIYNDDILRLIGWLLTDGSYRLKPYQVMLYQSTNRTKNKKIYEKMLRVLDSLNLKYSDTVVNHNEHQLRIYKNDLVNDILKLLPNNVLESSFICTLNQHQAKVLMWTMIEADGTLGDNSKNITYTCSSVEKRDKFQHLAFVAGYATNSYTITPEIQNNYPSSNKLYSSTSNKSPIKLTQNYYTVSVLRIKRAQIYPHHKYKTKIPFVWCVTTNNGSWIARRHGKVYITSNSVVQGSAADLTKMAILNLCNNKEWQKLGGRLLTPIHDELLCEVPMENWEEGGEVLTKCMVEAADFMPFTITCDVETTLRWYGNEFPCKYPKPTSLSTKNPEEIKWIQWHLLEMEYLLPVIKDENGDTPRGDGARGISGVITDEYNDSIKDYLRLYHITEDEFLEHIEQKVEYGIVS